MDIPKPQDTALLIHLKHSKPVEINEFTASLNAVGDLYCSFVRENGGCDEQAQAKLYVEKITEGSIMVYLSELVSANLIPFVENANTIIDFATFLKTVFEYYIHGIGNKPEITIQECRDFGNMLSVVAGDNKGEMEIGAVVKGSNNNILVGCTLNYTDGNAGQNTFKKEEERLRSVAPQSKIYLRQLMVVDQMRRDMTKDSGNKAMVDGISKKKLPVLFQTDELKKEILNSDCNPVKKAFFVDVEVQTANGKMVAYKVIALHDIIDI